MHCLMQQPAKLMDVFFVKGALGVTTQRMMMCYAWRCGQNMSSQTALWGQTI